MSKTMKAVRNLFVLLIVCCLLSSCATAPQAPQPVAPESGSKPAPPRVQPTLTPVPQQATSSPAKSRPAPVKAPLETTFVADYGELVLIEGGAFIMGDLYGTDRFAKPVHKVNVSGFFMGRHEVTFAQYDKFSEATNRDKPDDEGWGRGNRPVINVSWLDAVAFTEWLSQKTGRTFRLPSEAEWEYAARGGKSTHFWWGMKIGNELANCRQCSTNPPEKTLPVGTYKPNPYGLFDTAGNVYEWCLDHVNRNYVGAPADGSPWLSGDAGKRINRGGSWKEFAVDLQASARGWDNVDYQSNSIGFRVVMEP